MQNKQWNMFNSKPNGYYNIYQINSSNKSFYSISTVVTYQVYQCMKICTTVQ